MPALIERQLQAALGPLSDADLSIEDESHLHRGHAGARGGGGHFRLTIVSPQFEGLSMVARHRLVYQALSEQMGGAIHALALNAATPDEASVERSKSSTTAAVKSDQ